MLLETVAPNPLTVVSKEQQMSKQIDQDRIDSGDLSPEEVLYLQDRGLLPDHIEPVEVAYYRGEGLVSGDAAEDSEEESEEDEAEEGDEDETSEDNSKVELRLTSGDDETEDYDEGWTNVQRRAELGSRNLSVDGKKEDLIARLLRSDADELTEEDQAEEE